MSAPFEYGAADGAHKAEVGAAVEEGMAALCDELPQLYGGVGVFLVMWERGSAED